MNIINFRDESEDKNKKGTNGKKNKYNNLECFELNETEKENIFEKNNYISIKHIDSNTGMKSIYKFKSQCKNYIYYICQIRNKCKGKGKIDRNKKIFLITEKCDSKIEHNQITYIEFKNLIINKNIKNINFTNKYIQKYYVKFSIEENETLDNPTIKKKFLEFTGLNLTLSLSELAQIRSKILNSYKNIDLEGLVKKITIPEEEIEVYSFDLKYSTKQNKRDIERKYKIILFGIQKNIKLLNKQYTEEFFFDSTFKIIPSLFRPYKLFIISGLKKEEKKTFPILFVLIKYLDFESYDRLFTYLHINFEFEPKIVHSDFELALRKAIMTNMYTKNAIHVKCLFHYSQMIKKQLNKSGLFKRKLTKYSLEIIRNIEIICFLNKQSIKNQQELIIDKLKDNDKLKDFVNYLKKYLFKLDYSLYNYEDYLKNYDPKTDSNKYLERIYFTNNVIESLNAKINSYLPKRITTNYDFINSITKILINTMNINENIIRHDYVSKTLIKLINKYKINEKPKWISYREYIEENKNITKKGSHNIDENSLTELINLINDLDIDKDNKIEDNLDIKLDDSESDNESLNNNKDSDIISDNNSIEYSLIEDLDEGIKNLKININECENKNTEIETNVINNSEECLINKFPLRERIAKKGGIQKEKLENNILSNLDKKPHKRKFIYPEDDDEDNWDNRSKNNKKKKSFSRKKKKGWK